MPRPGEVNDVDVVVVVVVVSCLLEHVSFRVCLLTRVLACYPMHSLRHDVQSST